MSDTQKEVVKTFSLTIEVKENSDKTTDFNITGHAPGEFLSSLITFLASRGQLQIQSVARPVPPTAPAESSSKKE